MRGKANHIRVLLCKLFLLAACTTVRAGNIYVDDAAAGTNDGSSWANAYNYLQDAIATASAGDEIRVTQGVYTPDHGAGITPGDREATFQLINDVILKGGYGGPGEPGPDARDITLYKTILSGDLNGDDGPDFTNNSENSYHVVTGSEINSTAVLDGFTVTGGNADAELGAASRGGGMYNDGGSPTVAHCTFVGNAASAMGGGMYNYWYSNLTLTNCTFVGNVAFAHGGGITNFHSSPTLTDCRFVENSTTGRVGNGGGMSNTQSSHPTLTNCMFVKNSVDNNGGGMSSHVASNPILTNCIFIENSGDLGGALSSFTSSTPTLTNCILWSDSPDEIHLSDGNTVITYSDIQGGWSGEGNIDIDPHFAEPGYWDMDVWGDGDYHLKSQAGRWDQVSENWVIDDVTSPCIDAGNPNTPVAFEPFPNGGIINMGAYGGTTEASMSPSGIHAKYGGGSGTAENPYLIYTAEQMNTIGAESNDWDRHFKLMADIDLSGYSGTDFNIIGIGRRNAFTGVFDGNGHTISNFSYTSSNGDYTGLFRYVERSAQIKDLGFISPDINAGTGSCVGSLAGYVYLGTITNCYVEGGSVAGKTWIGGLVGYYGGTLKDCSSTCSVSGNDKVGGLVGYNSSGEITNCYAGGEIFGLENVGGLAGSSSGTIKYSSAVGSVGGGGRTVGGLVGRNSGPLSSCSAGGDVFGYLRVGGLVGSSSASIINCYATGGIFGTDYVGGLVGRTDDSIVNCYAIGGVSGTTYVGGLVGQRGHGGTIFTSFWDIETSGQLTSDGGTGKTSTEMQDPNTFMDAGWNFVGTSDGPSDIWAEPDGGGYPILWWQLVPLPELPAFSGGTGEPDDPYIVSTADELNSIGHNPRLMSAHFQLINDIDLAGINFFIIGGQYHPFGGTFDGNGHTISNFTYTSEYATCIGLFRYVAGGQIKDLGLIDSNVYVDRGDFHGCLVGHLGGDITNCYVEAGSVSGNDYVGGLVGFNNGDWDNMGAITNCYVTGFVRGDDYVGGLLGSNVGEITDCYAIADVNGNKYIGGLVGFSQNVSSPRSGPWPNIKRCYAAGRISGDEYVGGLAGKGGEGITHSFWDIETCGLTTSYGGEGKTTAEMQTAGTFLDAGWDFADETTNGTEDIWLILEGQDYPQLWWEPNQNGE